MKSIRQCIIEVASGIVGVPEARLTTGSPWTQLPSPFDATELVMSVEEAFGIEIYDQEFDGMHCLDDLIKTVERRQGEDPGISVEP